MKYTRIAKLLYIYYLEAIIVEDFAKLNPSVMFNFLGAILKCRLHIFMWYIVLGVDITFPVSKSGTELLAYHIFYHLIVIVQLKFILQMKYFVV